MITQRIPAVRSVAAGIWIGTGARSELPEENGMAHFLEHMVFKGTQRRSVADIAHAMDALGGHLDAYTSKELVTYNARVLAEHLPIAVDVLADMVRRPLLASEDIEKEKGVILEELKMEQDNPEGLTQDLFLETLWPNHPLGRPILGTRETVSSFTRDAVEGYFRRHYSPDNFIVTAAGNVRHEDFVALIEDKLGDAHSSDCSELDFEPPRSVPALTHENRRSVEQIHVCLGVPALSASDPRRFALFLLNVILGGCSSSRLFQEIREEMGAAYSVYSDISSFHDTGCFSIYAGTSRENVRPVLDKILEALRKLKQEPVGGEELRLAKDHLKGATLLSIESPNSRMTHLARQEMCFGRFFSSAELIRAVDRITAKQIQALAGQLFVPSQLALTMLGNLGRVRISRDQLFC